MVDVARTDNSVVEAEFGRYLTRMNPKKSVTNSQSPVGRPTSHHNPPATIQADRTKTNTQVEGASRHIFDSHELPLDKNGFETIVPLYYR